MVGGFGQRPVTTYYKPPDKLNKYIVNKETSFRNKKRLWNKLMNEQNNK